MSIGSIVGSVVGNVASSLASSAFSGSKSSKSSAGASPSMPEVKSMGLMSPRQRKESEPAKVADNAVIDYFNIIRSIKEQNA